MCLKHLSLFSGLLETPAAFTVRQVEAYRTQQLEAVSDLSCPNDYIDPGVVITTATMTDAPLRPAHRRGQRALCLFTGMSRPRSALATDTDDDDVDSISISSNSSDLQYCHEHQQLSLGRDATRGVSRVSKIGVFIFSSSFPLSPHSPFISLTPVFPFSEDPTP